MTERPDAKQTPQDPSPAAGWYADPAGTPGLRYWDGVSWTDHTSQLQASPEPQHAAGTTWSQPGWGAPAPADGSGFGAYAAASAPLAPSGMRRVEALFSDVGRIIKRGWWPITAASLLVWAAWLLVTAVTTAVLIDLPRFADALGFALKSSEQYPSDQVPVEVQNEIADRFGAALRIDSPVAWVIAAVLILLTGIWASCWQIGAVNRVAMDAASGREATAGNALRAGFTGGSRIFGYALLLVVAVLAAVLVLGGGAVLLFSVAPPLAVLVGLFGALALFVGAVFLFTRLLPLTAQAVVAPGALSWSWRKTSGKFWAVLGRWMLWSLVAYVAIQIISSALLLPMGLIAAATASADPTTLGWVLSLTFLISIPLSLVLNAASLLGVVPIWRDLTQDPLYRSIDDDGVPITVT